MTNSGLFKEQLKENGELRFIEKVVCPYCFYERMTGHWEGEYYSIVGAIEECESCDRVFELSCEPVNRYWYTTRKREESSSEYE